MKTLLTILFVSYACSGQAQINTQKIAIKQTVISPPPAKPAFMANATYVGGSEVPPNNSNTKVIFGGTVFDEGRNFSMAEAAFVAPSDGIYHFDVRVSWLRFSSPGNITVNLNTAEFSTIATSVQMCSTINSVFDSNYGTLLKLRAGQKISVYLKQNSNTFQRFQQVQLSGFKVE